MNITFETISELRPGSRLAQNAGRFWPAYRRWLLAGGGALGATPLEAMKAFRDHMPELRATFDRLVGLGPDDPLFPRFLTLYRPPAFIGACSMAAVDHDGRAVLVRNYDFDPALAEGVILESAWRGRRVLGMADCLWGLVDGVNEDGLAVALTFGGRREAGDGFGIPLILRYVLETCRDVADGIEALRAVPSHMAYNVGLVDGGGRHAIVHLAPGGGATLTDHRVATNHQDRVRWEAQARFTQTLERARHLEELLERPDGGASPADGFLRPPLYRTRYGAGFGTLYSALLDPVARQVTYRWPDARLTGVLGDLAERTLRVTYVEGQGARVLPGNAPAPANSDAFAIVLSSIADALDRAGRPLDRTVVDRLKRDGSGPWQRLGELFSGAA